MSNIKQKNSYNIWAFLSILSIIFISLYVLFNKVLSFDGAFHSQAAINLFETGKYVLDYSIGFTQIKVPFQLVNGFFLTLFGHNFIAANLANILFYVIFLWFIFKLNKEYKSSFIFAAFILISFSSGFLAFGFEGYGEVPGLLFGLAGLYIITKWPESASKIFIGAFLIGTSVATKWIFVLIIVPVGIVFFSQLFRKEYKYALYIVLGGVTALVIFWSIEYINYTVNIKQLVNGIITHTTPVNSKYYSNYAERIYLFWNEYSRFSGNTFMAVIKIAGYIQLIIIVVSFLIEALKKSEFKKLVTSNKFFVLLISLYALEYFFWWFLISSKPWYRRAFNADVMMIISLALFTIKENRVKSLILKASYYFSALLLLILLFFNIYSFFANEPGKQLLSNNKETIILESKLREGLDRLPKDFKAYGYDWWQAPRWSFLSGAKHKDLLNMPLEDKIKIEEGSEKYFVFFEPVNFVAMPLYNTIHRMFKLSTVFEYNKYSIKQILSKKDTSRVLSLIDYSNYDYNQKSGIYPRENGFCWYSQNAEILLNSMNKTDFIVSYFIPDISKYSSPPYLSIYFNNDLIKSIHVTTSGASTLELKVSGKYNSDHLIVKLEVSNPIIATGDSRNLGIPVKEIGFK